MKIQTAIKKLKMSLNLLICCSIILVAFLIMCENLKMLAFKQII